MKTYLLDSTFQGNVANAVIELGWKRVLMVSKNIGKDEEAMTLARNGIHVASTSKPCEIGGMDK